MDAGEPPFLGSPSRRRSSFSSWAAVDLNRGRALRGSRWHRSAPLVISLGAHLLGAVSPCFAAGCRTAGAAPHRRPGVAADCWSCRRRPLLLSLLPSPPPAFSRRRLWTPNRIPDVAWLVSPLTHQGCQCWLKKQKDTLAPDRQDAGPKVSWTSGLIFGQGQGIVGMETEYGTLHIKLFPDCAPHSVSYILELVGLRHCAGCQFYRAESRGAHWDSEGNHIKDAPFGPPFALIQGTMEAQGATFKKMPKEDCPAIRRGSVAWIGSGPEFFISLANHQEWKNAYTVFGSVLSEDMEIAEKIAELPTKPDNWNNINVSVLENPVSLLLRRIKASSGDL